jgi:ribose 1,5-bisphosphokinase
MSWIARALRVLTTRSKLIGPGRAVLVVGPSGAGKDTLIARARAACRGDTTVVFPARVVTRPPSIFEDNEFMPPSAFEQAAANGAFAIWWSAHGHMYGIPLAVDFDIEAGRTVVCNVSRAVVGAVRERYANVVTVLVTAPREVLGTRLAARARERREHRPSNEPRRARGRQVAAGCDHQQCRRARDRRTQARGHRLCHRRPRGLKDAPVAVNARLAQPACSVPAAYRYCKDTA